MSTKQVKLQLKKEQMLKWKEEFRCFQCQFFINPCKTSNDGIYRCGHLESHVYCKKCSLSLNNLCWIPDTKTEESPLEPMSEATLFFLQKMLKDFPGFCDNENQGCDAILSKTEAEIHKETCPFKRIQCPMTRCFVPITYQDFWPHFDTEHCSNQTCKVQPLKIEEFGRTFFLSYYTNDQSEQSGYWFFWVYLLGPKEDAKNFAYDFTWGNNTLEKARHYGQVLSMEVSVVEIVNDMLAPTFGHKMLKRMCNEEDFTPKVNIRQVKQGKLDFFK